MNDASLMTLNGLVLYSVPFRDYDRIITLFSEEGIYKVMMRGVMSKKRGTFSLATPLVLCEMVVKEGRGELYQFVEGKLQGAFRGLRMGYDQLEAAGKMAEAVLHSQMAGKRSPELYSMLLFLFQKLDSQFPSKGMVELFKIKLLVHEGLLAPAGYFTCEEWGVIERFAYGRSMSGVEKLAEMEERIERYFREAVGGGGAGG